MAQETQNVRFVDFWDNFDPEEYFLPLFRGLRSLEGKDLAELDFDLEFHSVFKKKDRSVLGRIKGSLTGLGKKTAAPSVKKPAFRVWYTAENRRPHFDRFHASLSFDKTDASRNNFRVPHWWLLFPELVGAKPFGQDNRRLGSTISLTEAVNGRKVETEPRQKFACAFFGRMWYPRRDIVSALSKLGEVDVFGPGSGKPVGSKLEVATQYRYVLCPENDLYPGYVTEKALEAWATGAIPIYWGQDAYSDLNPEAMVNLADLEDLNELVARIEELENNPGRAADMRAMPILSKAPDIAGLRAFLAGKIQEFVDAK